MITLSKAAEISKSRIDTLHPEFKVKVHDWYGACVQAGLIPYVYEGFRTLGRQAELFKMGPNVTRAQPGESYHNYGFAIDWVPIIRHDKAQGMYQDVWKHPMEHTLYAQGQVLGLDFGLHPLSWEEPHLQDVRFKHWTELKEKHHGMLK